MIRSVGVLLVLFTFASGCGGRQQIHIVPEEDVPRRFADDGTAVDAPPTDQVIAYLVEGNRTVAVARTGRSSLERSEVVMRALLSGPTEEELERGLRSAIPTEIELTSVGVNNGVAEVDFDSRTSEHFGDAPLGDLLLRIAQVVYTLTELDTIDSVLFLEKGQPVTIFDEGGNELTEPVARGRYGRYAPRSPLGTPKSEGPLRLDVDGEEEAAEPD